MNNDLLFFKIWRNVYLKSVVFNHIEYYKNNRVVSFKSIKELREYKYREYIHKLCFIGESKLSLGDLPDNGELSILDIPFGSFNDDQTIPYGVKEIIFSPIYCLISEGVDILEYLPNSVVSITNSSTTTFITNSILSNKPSKSLIPLINNLTELDLGRKWDNDKLQIKKSLFSNLNCLKTLKIPGYKELLNEGVLPNSITDLTVSHPRGWVIKKSSLPIGLKSLQLVEPDYSLRYNQQHGITLPVDGLPNSLTKLTVDTFSLDIKDNAAIPPSVTLLSILKPLKNHKPISKSILPTGLKKLEISITNWSYLILEPDALAKLPQLSSLIYKIDSMNVPTFIQPLDNKKLIKSTPFTMLPNTLTYLSLKVKPDRPFEKDTIGNCKQLKSLILSNYDYPLICGMLPDSLIYLELESFNQSINNGVLLNLKSLTSLKFGNSFNQSFDISTNNCFPQNLLEISLGSIYNKQIPPNVLPCNLKTLEFGLSFDQPLLLNTFPDSLKKLTFSRYGTFSHPIDQVGLFPNNLKELQFGNFGYSHQITKQDVFPDSLTTLTLTHSMDLDNFLGCNVLPRGIINLKILK